MIKNIDQTVCIISIINSILYKSTESIYCNCNFRLVERDVRAWFASFAGIQVSLIASAPSLRGVRDPISILLQSNNILAMVLPASVEMKFVLI